MNELLEQLSLDQTFFTELALVAVTFLALSQFYFKPFLELIEARHKKTVEDRESAERIAQQAEAKLAQYQRTLGAERARIKKQFEVALQEAKKQESLILSQAREEAKRLTQEAVDAVHKQREGLSAQIQAEVEQFAQSISERLLSRGNR